MSNAQSRFLSPGQCGVFKIFCLFEGACQDAVHDGTYEIENKIIVDIKRIIYKHMCLYQVFVKLKNEFIEIVLTTKRMICNPIMMILNCLWIVITFQENNWIQQQKKLAEQDLNNRNDEMPNEFIQGTALTAQLCTPSLAIRSALTLQFWIFYWKLERQRLQLSKSLPSHLTDVGQTVPNSAKIIPVVTESINVFSNDHFNIETISLHSLIKQGRYLVVNFGSCT
ncbi:unnamed protein product [Rotaria sp. Silwood2]|nr:unnamed protein product [Rotaria sp. Silwood2]CAF3488831.1 unnamed protein product [Rotaria sp. Silwood2]CAF4453510.1 unnamed protein product [Rotaria sp. Silwood2]CAF4688946.1 unnamed protein product [Rotaria sp. Silwood2]